MEADEITIMFTDKESGLVCSARIAANIQQTKEMTLLTLPKGDRNIQFEYFSKQGAELVVAHWKQKTGKLF